MKVEMLYGDRSLSLELPEEKVAALLEAKPLPAGKGKKSLLLKPWPTRWKAPGWPISSVKVKPPALLSVI
jgi:hypothetical protein